MSDLELLAVEKVIKLIDQQPIKTLYDLIQYVNYMYTPDDMKSVIYLHPILWSEYLASKELRDLQPEKES